MATAVNERLGYFVTFDAPDAEKHARSFVAELPFTCRAELNEDEPVVVDGEVAVPSDGHWFVVVKGPWTAPWDAENWLTPLAKKHQGVYDGEEDV